MLRRGNSRSSGAVEHDFNFADVLAHNLQRIEQRGSGDDGRAMLVVVKNRNVHRLPQGFFDVKTLRRLDVLQIDASEGKFQQLADFDDVVRIVTVDFDVEYIDIGKTLEEHSLTFHHRFARESADIAQSRSE